LAERSRTIDAAELGRRLKRVRIAAGMTQADVARPDVTGAYLSRIEDGQRRPDFELLRKMVERLDTTLEAILAGSTPDELNERRVLVDHAELKLVSGDASGALEDALAVLAHLSGHDSRSDVAKLARVVQAGALEVLGDPNGAIVILEDLTKEPTADATWLRNLISLSRCYRDTGDLSRAVAVGEQAQDLIVELGIEGLTEAIQLSVTVAGAHMLAGNLDLAMRTCQRAIEQGERYESIVGKASAYWNASVIESKRGRGDHALTLARKALTCFELGEDGRNLGRLRAQVATLQLRQSPPDPRAALETLDRAELELANSAASDLDRAGEILTRARAHYLLGELDDARRYLADCEETAPGSAIFIRASVEALRGEVALVSNDTSAAKEYFRSAVTRLTGMGADRDAAQLWFQLGTSLAQLGDAEAAIDALSRAGASTGLVSTPLPAPVRSRVDA